MHINTVEEFCKKKKRFFMHINTVEEFCKEINHYK